MACLYRHIREDIKMPFYIGIGVDIKRAYSKKHRNSHWQSIISKTNYKVEILFDDIDYEFAKTKEKEFISLYKRKIDGGILCNLTLGGDGVLGIVHTENARKKMSIANKGKIISEIQKQKTSQFHKGRKRREETKKKLSESKLGEKNPRYGIKTSIETKDKMSKSAKKGVNNFSSKLTELKVLEIRELYKKGISSRKLSKKFNVSKSNILSIVNNKTWKHV